jgi:ABC-type bacteriocin/lantibiotic exporter with double-glycine peptidase domain
MSEPTNKNAFIRVEHAQQTTGLCGPASLKILLSHFGKIYTEKQLQGLASATMDSGTEHEGMIQAVKEIGGFVFAKENSTIQDLEYFLKEEKLPTIIGWFDKDGDHYSVVISITDKNIVISDPAADEPERWIDRETFPAIWFDFVGADNRTVSWGWLMVVTFEKKHFPKIQGGYYY